LFDEYDRLSLRPEIYAVVLIDRGGQGVMASQGGTFIAGVEDVVVIRGEAIAAGRRGSSVIVASNEPSDAELLDQLRLEAGDEGDVVRDLGDYAAGASVLTDDFAPVDQLIAAGS